MRMASQDGLPHDSCGGLPHSWTFTSITALSAGEATCRLPWETVWVRPVANVVYIMFMWAGIPPPEKGAYTSRSSVTDRDGALWFHQPLPPHFDVSEETTVEGGCPPSGQTSRWADRTGQMRKASVAFERRATRVHRGPKHVCYTHLYSGTEETHAGEGEGDWPSPGSHFYASLRHFTTPVSHLCQGARTVPLH